MKEKKYRYNVPAIVIFDVIATSRKKADELAKRFAVTWDAYGFETTLTTGFERVLWLASENVEPNFHHVQPEVEK
jgi:hypothetical protein